MGNICSSTQSNCKDTESEISEGNADQDVEFKAENLDEKSEPHPGNNHLVSDSEALTNNSEVVNEVNPSHRDPESTLETEENKSKIDYPASNHQLAEKEIEPYKKVVLLIITSNILETSEEYTIISRIVKYICAQHKVKGFEVTLSFTSHVDVPENDTSSNERIVIDTPSELQRENDELENYLAELDRHGQSYVIPILFLGNSLGKLGIPLTIEAQDFKALVSAGDDKQCKLLHTFYKENNSSDSDCVKLVLDSALNKNTIEEILVTLIQLMPIHHRDIYLLSAFEQKTIRTLLGTNNLAKRCIYVQTADKAKHEALDPIIQAEVVRRLSNTHAQLKGAVLAMNTISSQLLSDVDTVENCIKFAVDSVINEHCEKYNKSRNTRGMTKQTYHEIEAARKVSTTIGRHPVPSKLLEAVLSYIRSDSLFPLAVFGKKGSGKSALAANIAINLNKFLDNPHIIIRYANLSVVSSEISSLLGSISEELAIHFAEETLFTKHDVSEYKRTIEQLLDNTKGTVLLIIDDSDRITGVNNFNWLPKILKPNVKIIVTITSDDSPKDMWTWKDLTQQGLPEENLLLLHNYLSPKENGNVHEINYQAPRYKLATKMPWSSLNQNDILSEEFIRKLVNNVESEMDTNILVMLLSTISISTYGLYETDCLSILREQVKIDDILSFIMWSKFCWIMGSLILHTEKSRIAHSELLKNISKMYSKNRSSLQQCAIEYFNRQPDSSENSKPNLISHNIEKYLMLPSLDLALASQNDNGNALQQYFNKYYFKDLSWISKKISACGSIYFLNDILLTEEMWKNRAEDFPHIEILKEFLQQHIWHLSCDGNQLYTLLKSFLQNVSRKNSALATNDQINNWIAAIDESSISYFECVNDFDEVDSKEADIVYSEVASIKGPGNLIAAVSTSGDEISIWDVTDCKRIRVLKGISQPSLVVPIRDFEAAVLCKREIKVIDFENGEYKTTLKGVMNQKMPYFGLHDEDHLVCLSRNRMYVNLMHLRTGDCITSFKAGEDRFLNSLIVSGNGRILVCGDESQKPFSLLVWHLQQRRLLYDLRIPHHDLFTSLSAITYEGSFVTVVAKEIKESGPNFIVVYDLQSGTLFQKLKPSFDTVALAISQANGCVIAGLENADILIWDLVTGNCRHILSGHTAPVTRLKLDPTGSCLLSYVGDGHDKSLRLWDLSTGNSLAAFTPSEKISSFEITENGQFTIVTLEKASRILILRLRNFEKADVEPKGGDKDNKECKTFDLSINQT